MSKIIYDSWAYNLSKKEVFMILGKKIACLPLIYSMVATVSLFIIVMSTASAVNFNVRSSLVKAANIKTSGNYTFSHCRALRKKPFDDQYLRQIPANLDLN